MKKLLPLSIAAALALPVHADVSYSNLYIFGDSLLDSGNLGLRFTNRVGDGNGDFTVGDYARIAPQYLGEALTLLSAPAAAGGTNWAVGGYETADILNSINGTGLALPAGGAVARQAFLNETPRIDPDALVLIDGGGNDFLNGTATDQASIINSARTLLAAAQALSDAGANYILFANLPDLGQTAALQAQDLGAPGSAAAASAGAAGYNSALEAFSAFGSANLVPVDLAGLISYVSDNAEAFGFVSGTNPAFGPLAGFDQRYMCFDDSGNDCVEHPIFGIDGSNPNPDVLIFNDGVHPTAQMGAITGDYLISVVNGPQDVGLIPELGLDIVRSQRGATTELRRQQQASPGESRWTISGVGLDAERVAGNDSRSLNIGFSSPLSEQLDSAVVLSFGDHESESARTDFSATSVGLSGLLSYRDGGWLLQGAAGLSVVDYDSLDRDVKLGPQTLTAKGGTNGFGWHLDGLLSYEVLGDSSISLRPAVGWRWMKAEVDSYRESGAAVANTEWGEQRRDSQVFRAGLLAGVALGDGVRGFAEVFAATEMEDHDETVTGRNRNLGFGDYQMPSYREDGEDYVEASVGISAALGSSRVAASVEYSDEAEGREALIFSFSRPL